MTSAEQEGWAARKRMVDVGDLAMAYVDIAGDGPPLLLVHGFTDTSRSFSLLAPHLAGRRLIMPDLRGHGASQTGTSRFRPADFADDLAGLTEKLQLERPVVVGHSLGAMVAIEMAARHGGLVGELVLLAGTLKADIAADHPMVTGVEALRDPISPTHPFYDYWHACRSDVPRPFLVKAAQEASAMPAALWRAILEQIRHADLTQTVRPVNKRALVVGGACDPLFGDAHQQALVQALADAFFVRVEGCGHNPHWEEPALVAAAITVELSRAGVVVSVPKACR